VDEINQLLPAPHIRIQGFQLFEVVLATGPGNPPAVGDWTGTTVQFGSRTVQRPDLLLLGGANPAPYP